jgi:heat shock protein HspQ
LFAENEEIFYIAYVSEQNLLLDKSNKQCNHPGIKEIFESFDGSSYLPHKKAKN